MRLRALHTIPSTILALSCGWLSTATAQPQTGDLLITESGPGEVTNITAGGDMTAQTAFAHHIPTPMGLCRGPNDDLYVSSQEVSAPGAVYVITAGGDVSSATAFAEVPGFPTSLACTDSEILVATITAGGPTSEIYDVSSGTATLFAEGFGSQLWTILRDRNGVLWGVTEAGSVFDASAGGDVSGTEQVTNIPAGAGGRGLAHPGALYVGAVGNGSIYDITGGGDIAGATPFAFGVGTIRGLFGYHDVGFYAANQSMVYDVSGGDDVAAAVFAHGLGDMVNAQMVYWHGCGDDVLWTAGGEECDDGNTDDGDGCAADCTDEGAGGGGGGQGGGATGGAGGTGATGGTGGSAGATPVTPTDDDDGCGCRVGVGAYSSSGQAPTAFGWLALLGLAGLARRRVRRR